MISHGAAVPHGFPPARGARQQDNLVRHTGSRQEPWTGGNHWPVGEPTQRLTSHTNLTDHPAGSNRKQLADLSHVSAAALGFPLPQVGQICQSLARGLLAGSCRDIHRTARMPLSPPGVHARRDRARHRRPTPQPTPPSADLGPRFPGRSLASHPCWSGPGQGWPAGPSPQATRSALDAGRGSTTLARSGRPRR